MSEANPFLNFQSQPVGDEDLFLNDKQPCYYDDTQPHNLYRIKRRKIVHKKKFGRGANHPSFFLRKFFSKIENQRFQKIYEGHPEILSKMMKKSQTLKNSKKRFNLQDLKQFFGQDDTQSNRKESYLNSKMFYKAISQLSLEMIMEESKCNQVLNHLISMEKYSGRLINPLLTGRVEFQ